MIRSYSEFHWSMLRGMPSAIFYRKALSQGQLEEAFEKRAAQQALAFPDMSHSLEILETQAEL